MNTYEMLQKIKSLSGKNDKISTLAEFLTQNPAIEPVLRYGLTPSIHFGVKNICNYADLPEPKISKPTNLFDFFRYIGQGETFRFRRSEEMDLLVRNVLCHLSEEDFLVAKSVMEKDLGIGVARSSANKAIKLSGANFPPILELAPMKAEKEKDHPLSKLDFSNLEENPIIAQEKIDASRSFIVMEEGSTKILSTTGKEVPDGILDNIREQANTVFARYGVTGVIDGEIAFRDPETGELLPRRTSNGIFNRALNGSISEEQEAECVFVAWDYIERLDISCLYGLKTIPQKKYRDRLVDLFNALDSWTGSSELMLKKIPTRFPTSVLEIRQFANEVIARGGEGLVVKVGDLPYVAKRSKNMIKVKKQASADVLVTDINEGKNPGTLGSLSYCTDDGRITGRISGISDADKKLWWDVPDLIVGKVIAVSYMELSHNETDDTYTLYGPPTIIEIREDKTETSKLEQLL